MKQFPYYFPIRYAIIVEGGSKKILECDILEEESLSEKIIFKQLLSFLQTKPLDKNSLCIPRVSATFSIMGMKLFELSKLQNEINWKWADYIEKAMGSVFMDIKIESKGMGGVGLGFYSYRGASELPAFWTFRKKGEESTSGRRPRRFRSYDYGDYAGIYSKLAEGKMTGLEFYKISSKHRKPISITIPYSPVWEFLDENRKFEGFIPPIDDDLQKEELAQELPEKFEKEKKNGLKIDVLVCRSLEDLFVEEITTLYKMFFHCNNCGKPLPFNYKGKYCPESPENEKCIRERAKIRKRKSQVDE